MLFAKAFTSKVAYEKILDPIKVEFERKFNQNMHNMVTTSDSNAIPIVFTAHRKASIDLQISNPF
jgi:hypothetical protein